MRTHISTAEYLQLYSDYIDELDQIEKIPPTPRRDKLKWAVSYLNEPYANIIPVYEKNVLSGFLIICNAPECHPDCDWFIAQTYLKPEYRRKGIMSSRVKEFIQDHPGKYCLFIVNNNEAAKNFWKKTFEEMDYERFSISEIATPERCTQYGYRPKLSSCV